MLNLGNPDDQSSIKKINPAANTKTGNRPKRKTNVILNTKDSKKFQRPPIFPNHPFSVPPPPHYLSSMSFPHPPHHLLHSVLPTPIPRNPKSTSQPLFPLTRNLPSVPQPSL